MDPSTHRAIGLFSLLSGVVLSIAHAEEDSNETGKTPRKVFAPRVSRDQLCPFVFKELPKSISVQGVKKIRFSYDDRFLIAWGTEGGSCTKVFAADGECVLEIHGPSVLSENRKVLAADYGFKPQFWDLEKWDRGRVFEHSDLLALSRDGRSALITRVKSHPTLDFSHLRDTLELVRCFQDGKQSFPLETKNERKYLRAAGFSYDQESILAVVDSEGSLDTHIRYDITSGEMEEKIDRPSWNKIGAGSLYSLSQPTPSDLVLFTSRPFATDYGHSSWRAIDNDFRIPHRKFLPDGGIGTNRVVFSEDGKLFSVFGKNLGYGYRKDVVLGRRDEAKYRFHFRRRPDFYRFDDLAVAFSRAAPLAAVAIDQEDGRLRLVNLGENPNDPIQLLNCQEGTPQDSLIADLDFSASGNLLVGADAKRNAIRLWNVNQRSEYEVK